jgi:hypothetical protein
MKNLERAKLFQSIHTKDVWTIIAFEKIVKNYLKMDKLFKENNL